MARAASTTARTLRTAVACALLAAAGPALAGLPVWVVNIPGNTTAPVDLGLFGAGTYELVGTGLVDLAGGASFQIRPDGVPDAPITFPGYAYFNPSGSYIADGNYGQAGTNAKIGALVGTFNGSAYMGLNPSAAQQADWFLIGYGTTLTLTAPRHIYAAVNDTFAANNAGSFQVVVTLVPEPAQWATALAGLALLGGVLGRRRRG